MHVGKLTVLMYKIATDDAMHVKQPGAGAGASRKFVKMAGGAGHACGWLISQARSHAPARMAACRGASSR